MPIIGKLADLYGRNRIFLSCMALFMAGSIVCGLADSMVLTIMLKVMGGTARSS